MKLPIFFLFVLRNLPVWISIPYISFLPTGKYDCKFIGVFLGGWSEELDSLGLHCQFHVKFSKNSFYVYMQ